MTTPLPFESKGVSQGIVKLYSASYFVHCGVAGLLASGVSHAALTPIDTLKCNMQAHRHISTLAQAWRALAPPLGASRWLALSKGFGATFVGYGAHGATKFMLYDVFKHRLALALGPHNADRYRDIVYIAASACAELVASVVLCPFEARKVRAQVQLGAPPPASLWVGLGPLLTRQVPFSIVKFMTFERVAELAYALSPTNKADMSATGHFAVVLASGVATGLFCGAVSHPADVLVTQFNARQIDGHLWTKTRVVVDDIGVRGLLRGFTPRAFSIGAMTAIQWVLYGTYKAVVGLPTPGLG